MRELFWASQLPYINDIFSRVLIISALALVVLIALFAFSACRLYWTLQIGKEGAGLLGFFRAVPKLLGYWQQRAGEFWRRLLETLAVAFVHIRTLKEAYPGWMHLLIFWGTVLLITGKIIRIFSFAGDISNPPQSVFLYASLASEIGAVAVFVGGALAIFRRYVLKPSRLDTVPGDTLVFGWAFLIMLTGFMAKGFRIATAGVPPADWAMWSPVGYAFSHLFLIFPDAHNNFILVYHRAIVHTIAALVFLGYILVSRAKLNHLWLAPLNIFSRSLAPKGMLVPVDLEKAETFGTPKVENFTSKQLLDLEACVKCGRCQDACPAWASGKKLSPKQVIQDLKTHLHETYPLPFVSKPVDNRRDMISEAITDEVIWDCTSCLACDEVCPIYVQHVDKIVDMRRNLVLEQSRMPETLQGALMNIGTRGHPMRGTALSRIDWMKDLDVKIASEAGGEIDLLYWVGCTSALDERNIAIPAAVTKILKAAGVNFAVLGNEESCCGDPARRSGDEYLFQTLCQKNIEIFKTYNVKKILASCPHCFNVFQNEYPQFGGNFGVVHHTQFIAELVRQGRLKVGELGGIAIAYHDSCYLGRYNDIYEEPREILAETGIRLVELSRHHDKSFCCGGGGGHMWLEEPPDKRVNIRRVEEVISAGVNVVATACPYCLTMFEDALKAKAAEETIKARDISELVVEAARLK